MSSSDLFPDAATPDDFLEKVAIDAPEGAWPSLLAEMVAVLEGTFRRSGLGEEDALQLAQRAAIETGRHFGGRPFYLPKGDRLVEAVRDRMIWRRHNGSNKFELAREYGLTPRRVEQILAEQRAIHVRKIQPGLFPEGAS